MDIQDIPDLDLPEKEEKILKAAIKVFSEKGFSASTTSEIAKSAGVAEGTIFRYFKTKKDILRGILIQTLNLVSGKIVMDGVEKILKDSEGKDLRTIAKELIYDRMKLLDKFYPMARVVISEAIYHDDVRDAIFQNIIVRAMDAFSLFHTKMAERGMIRADLDSHVIFRSILGNFAILIAQRKLLSDKFSAADLETDIDRMIDIVLHGIEPANTNNKPEGRK